MMGMTWAASKKVADDKKAAEAEAAIPDWFKNAPDAKDEAEEVPEWFTSAKDAGPDPENIESDEITTWGQSVRLSGLEKREDKLRALREYYPDAELYGDDNFIFTDPATGKTHMFNQPGWIPNGNDFAGTLPAIAEITGAIMGGVGGGVTGGVVGTAVAPGPGTAAGTATGAVTGAGFGGASFREAMQDLIQWYNGDDDTRTNEEALQDFGTNALISGAGEGLGRIAVGVSKPIIKKAKQVWTGAKPSAAAQKAFLEAQEMGVNPTLGMTMGDDAVMKLEAGLMKQFPEGPLAKNVKQLDEAIAAKPQQFAREISPIDTSRDGVGTLLRDAAKRAETNELTRLQGMYKEFETAAGGRQAIGTNLDDIARQLQAEKANMGKAQLLTNKKPIDDALRHTKAIQADIKKGIPIEDVRTFRTNINPLAYGKTENPIQKEYFQRIYKAATDDLVTTAKSVSDDALKKMQDADAAFSAYKTTSTKKILEKAIKEQEPTAVFKFYSDKINDAPKNLAVVRDTLTKDGNTEAWDSFVAYHVKELGQKTTEGKGVHFSGGRLVTQLAKIPKESKDVLFSGRFKDYGANLGKLSRIAQARQTARQVKVKDDPVGKVLNSLMSRTPMLGLTKKGYNKLVTEYQQRLLSNPDMVRELIGLPAASMKKGKTPTEYLMDAAARAGETELMRNYIKSLEEDEK